MAATKQMILDTFFDFFGCGLRSASHKTFQNGTNSQQGKVISGSLPNFISH